MAGNKTLTVELDMSRFIAAAKDYSDALCALACYAAETIGTNGIDGERAKRIGLVDDDGCYRFGAGLMIEHMLWQWEAAPIYDHRCAPGCTCANTGCPAPCAGPNCGCTDGKSHSAECVAAHEAAYTGAKA